MKEQRPIPGGTLGLSAGVIIIIIIFIITVVILHIIVIVIIVIYIITRSGSTHRREAEEAWLREADARPASRSDVDSRRLMVIMIFRMIMMKWKLLLGQVQEPMYLHNPPSSQCL